METNTCDSTGMKHMGMFAVTFSQVHSPACFHTPLLVKSASVWQDHLPSFREKVGNSVSICGHVHSPHHHALEVIKRGKTNEVECKFALGW